MDPDQEAVLSGSSLSFISSACFGHITLPTCFICLWRGSELGGRRLAPSRPGVTPAATHSSHLKKKYTFEPQHGKTNKMICAPSEDSDQSGHSLCAQRKGKDPRFLHADNEDADQTGWMPRLIRVFARRTSFVCFCCVMAYFSFVFTRTEIINRDYKFHSRADFQNNVYCNDYTKHSD